VYTPSVPKYKQKLVKKFDIFDSKFRLNSFSFVDFFFFYILGRKEEIVICNYVFNEHSHPSLYDVEQNELYINKGIPPTLD
jgi:hypothetical protein